MKIMNKLEEYVKKEDLVLVDFHAEWCGPCKMMAPILQEVKRTVGDSAKIIKIDIDKNSAISNKLKIRSVPTFQLYKAGKVVWQHSGTVSKHELEKLIRQYA